MRDLFVFLVLFFLGLAVWSTGLFPPIQVQAVSPLPAEIQLDPFAVGQPAASEPQGSQELAPPPVDKIALPELREESLDLDNVARDNLAEDNNGAKSTGIPPKNGSVQESPRESEDLIESEQAIQRIIIPSLKVDAHVVDVPFNGVTWDISDLGQDIARLGDVPGENAGENVVLAGHFSIGWTELGPFRYISRLALGAPILIYTDQMIYTFQVREHAVVGDRDERVIAHSSKPQLTLLTCETWDEKTRKFLRRRVVFADLVRSEPLGHPTIQ